MSEQLVKVENANLAKVLFYLDKVVSETGRYCNCKGCMQEAAARALNTLPPHYYPACADADLREKGSPWILVDHAVRESLEHVSRKYNHVSDTDSTDQPTENVA